MKMNLCGGRHDMPAKENIFDEAIADVKNLAAMNAIVAEKLKDVEGLDLYVTGLTVALGEVVNYCFKALIPLTLWHWDRESGEYFPQIILSDRQCHMLNYDHGIKHLVV